MIKDTSIKQENFDTLLGWLDRNRDIAGAKYEKIRQRLIRIFASRGCFEAEELADETINRVTLKLPQIINEYTGEPAYYFHGVASNLHHEWLRKQKKLNNLMIPENGNHYDPESEIEFECLESCLEGLPREPRELIIEYYKREKGAKIEVRRALAEKFGINLNALQGRTHRIRKELQACVQNCAAEKKNKRF